MRNLAVSSALASPAVSRHQRRKYVVICHTVGDVIRLPFAVSLHVPCFPLIVTRQRPESESDANRAQKKGMCNEVETWNNAKKRVRYGTQRHVRKVSEEKRKKKNPIPPPPLLPNH